MRLKSTEQLDNICEALLEKYSLHLKECVEQKKSSELSSFWEGKYDAIYELLMIIDSPLWYKLHKDSFNEIEQKEDI